MAAVGVETGGANVQFAVDPHNGRALVIEMNPRVSRSSALASKATGFPIAKIAALVAAGYTLDEITNDITGQTVAAFEPALDYVVVKIPRWSFEKFPGVDTTLGPQMKSVGEVMALGSTFSQALLKAVQSLETGVDAPDGSGPGKPELMDDHWNAGRDPSVPSAGRLFAVYRALRSGTPPAEIAELTGIDAWFLAQMREIVALESELRGQHPAIRLSAGTACARPNAPGLPTRTWRACCRAPASRRSALDVRGLRQAAGHPANLPARGYLRGRVRSRRPPTCTAPTSRKTKPGPRPAREDPDPGRRAEPHRAGHRVRLLLLPGRLSLCRAGV